MGEKVKDLATCKINGNRVAISLWFGKETIRKAGGVWRFFGITELPFLKRI